MGTDSILLITSTSLQNADRLNFIDKIKVENSNTLRIIDS